MKIEVEFYGPTKDYFYNPVETLHFDHPVNVKSIKEALLAKVKDDQNRMYAKNLLQISALATEHEILSGHCIVNKTAKLALLPPVSGG